MKQIITEMVGDETFTYLIDNEVISQNEFGYDDVMELIGENDDMENVKLWAIIATNNPYILDAQLCGKIIGSHSFVSGTSYYLLDSVDNIEIGSLVSWEEYKGKVEAILLFKDGNIEISFDSPIGRVPLTEINLIKS